MNIHFGNQSQFELFPGTTGDPIENTAPRFIFSRVVLTFENVVVIFVFVIVSLIIAFSMGVERGRVKARLARPALIQSTASALPSVMPNTQISITTSGNAASGSVPALSGTAIASTQIPVVAPAVRPMLRPAAVSAVSRPIVTAPVAPIVPARASEKVVDKGYTIQVASYKSDSMAQKESADLKRQGLESFVVTKGNYLIVCVGRFSGQDEAKSMFNKLKKRYKDSIVRSF